MISRFRVFALVSFATIATASQASFTMIERTTAMNVGWQYGSGFEVYPGSNGLSSSALNSEYYNRLIASESHSGLASLVRGNREYPTTSSRNGGAPGTA